MKEAKTKVQQDLELKLDDLDPVTGGTGGSIQSEAACPQCGKHTLYVDFARNTTVCNSCGYENRRLCVSCGSMSYYYDPGDHHQYCHNCGWA